MRRVGAALVAAGVLAIVGATSAGPSAAAPEPPPPETAVHLDPGALEALISRNGQDPLPPELDGTPGVMLIGASIVEDQGCTTPGEARIIVATLDSNGGTSELVTPCGRRVGVDPGAAAAWMRDRATLNRATLEFDPRVRGLVGLRTWMRIVMPERAYVSAALGRYELRAIAIPELVSVRDNGRPLVPVEKLDVAERGARIGPFVFTRPGRHRIEVQVRWSGTYVLVGPNGVSGFGSLPAVSAATTSATYVVAQAQAVIR